MFVFRSWYKTFVLVTTSARQTDTRIATFKLPDEDYRRLEQIAASEERSVSAVLRLAVRSYIEGAGQETAA